MITAPGMYELPELAYHGDPCHYPSLSHSVAHLLLTRSPRHAWFAHPKLNPTYEAEESVKFDAGRAAHHILLEGEEKLAIVDAADWRSKAAKEARIAAREAGRIPILSGDVDRVRRMREEALQALLRSPDLRGITFGPSGLVERVLAWQEGPIWCRGRPDWMSADRVVRIDYKTTDGSANPDAWLRTMLSTGADLQDVFYGRGVELTGGPRLTQQRSFFLVQETDPPYACSLVGLDPQFRELAMEKYARAVATWERCLRTNEWPGYPDRICYLAPPTWLLAQHEEANLDATESGIPYDVGKLWEKRPMQESDPA